MFSTFGKNVIVPLLLRLGLAAVFVFHGLGKVSEPAQQWGANWMQGPEPQATVLQLAVAWGELTAGLALAASFLTRLAALGIIVIMGGAIATVNLPHGFAVNQGFEYNMTLIVMAACLVVGGPGPLAADWLFRFRHRGS